MKYNKLLYLIYVCCFFPQDDRDTPSNKESLDDLFPTEDEEQSQSESLC